MSVTVLQHVRAERWFAFCGLIAPLVFTVGWFVAGWLEPGYRPLREDVSVLAAASAGNPGPGIVVICLSGVLVAAMGAGLAIGRRHPPLLGALVVLSGAMVTASGALRIDCSPDTDAACMLRASGGTLSLEHRAHGVAITVAFVAILLTMGLVALGQGRAPGGRAAAIWCIVAGAGLFLAFRSGAAPEWRGALERGAATVPLLWLALLAAPIALRPAPRHRADRWDPGVVLDRPADSRR